MSFFNFFLDFCFAAKTKVFQLCLYVCGVNRLRSSFQQFYPSGRSVGKEDVRPFNRAMST